MADETRTVVARVSHQPDRSYLVLIDGPGGEVEVGRTTWTREVLSIARAGAAGLGAGGVTLVFPQPPYGTDGQWVRVDHSEYEEAGALGKAYWFAQDAAWFVTVVDAGTGIYPSEHLDFAPVVTGDEMAAFDAYVARAT